MRENTTSSVMSSTLFALRSSGLKVVDSYLLLTDHKVQTSIQNLHDIDILISQCYHSKIPYLIVISSSPSFTDSREEKGKISNNFLAEFPLQVRNR